MTRVVVIMGPTASGKSALALKWARERGGEIVFLRRIARGGAPASYGVEVAKLAGLPGSVIASVFNQLGSLGGIALFIPVFLIGHTLNFGLNVIGCFVHTMRLQFLEFFGKWYRDGGIPFRPLQMQTKFVDIKED